LVDANYPGRLKMAKFMKSVSIMTILALVLALGAVFVPGGVALAADTGQQSPTANYGPSATDWSIPTYAYADDGNTTAGPHGALQIYHDYGFSIPAGSTIDGIEVTLEGAYFSESNPGDPTTAAQIKVEVSWGGGATGTISGTRTQVITGTATTYTIGGAADTWGHSWTVSELSNANFRVRIFAETTPTTAGHFARLDWLPVTVYYTAPAAVPSITSVSPDSGHRGATQDVTITGENFTGTTTVSFGSGITVNGFTEDSDTQITADITIAGVLTGGTMLGTRDVSVTTAGGTDTLTGGFTVTAPDEVWVDDDYSDSGDNDGHTWGVDAFASIQDGIDAVGASTVNVLPGTYNENIEIDKSLTLQSTDGYEDTIIDGSSSDDVIDITALDGVTVTIDGFTVQNGDSYGIVAYSTLENGSVLTIENCEVIDNDSEGIQIYDVDNSVVTITGCYVNLNGTDGSGDGIDFYGDVKNGSIVTITDSDFNENGNNVEASDGDGIDFDNIIDSSVVIDNNDVLDNYGYGVHFDYITTSEVEITDNFINGNGWYGICLENYTEYGAEVEISGNEINGNDWDGIFVYDTYGDPETTLAIFENDILENAGSGIYLAWPDDDSVTDIHDNVISDNEETGIYINEVWNANAVVNIYCNTISGNLGLGEGMIECGVYIGPFNEDEGDYGNYEDYQVITVSPCNDIFDNDEYGVYNESGYMVDATGNWWGDPSGPSGEGPGSGDAVSEDVDYDGYLFAPCGEEVLKAGFTLTPQTGQAPLTVQFYDTSTGAATWFWEFGDGGVSEAQYPTYTYQNEGVYSVRLTIEGPGGGTDDASNQVIVEASAGAPNLVVRNLYISGTQVMPRDKVVITADVFNEGEAWGDGDIDLIINGAYEQTVGVGVAPGTPQPISFTVYKVTPGTYQVTVGNATGTFYVLEEQQPSQIGGIPMDTGTLIALCIIGLLVIVGMIVAIIYLKPS
jgi:PKD repeat protein